MKTSIVSDISKKSLIAQCDRIVNSSEHLSRLREAMKVEVLVFYAGGYGTWPALTSAPNTLYRMLKSVKGVKKVQVEIVSNW